jgi:hypothetical protein
MDLLLDGTITREEHNSKRKRIKERQLEIGNQLRGCTVADDNFRQAVVDLLGLTRKAHELFVGSNNEGKRRLINFVFSNLTMRGVTIEYSLRKPFDQFITATDRIEWLGYQDSNLGCRYQKPVPYRLAIPQHIYMLALKQALILHKLKSESIFIAKFLQFRIVYFTVDPMSKSRMGGADR